MQNENLQLVLSDDTILQISVIHSKDRAPISDTTSHVIHINQLLNQTVSGTQHLDLSGKISKLLKQLGITPNLKGYLYLRQAIEIGVRDPSVFDGITKRLYPHIAEQNHTTSTSVERTIRHAIDTVWSKGNKELFWSITQTCTLERPTNSQFIIQLAEYFTEYKTAFLSIRRTVRQNSLYPFNTSGYRLSLFVITPGFPESFLIFFRKHPAKVRMRDPDQLLCPVS